MKLHHNDAGIVRKLRDKHHVIEPLMELFKPEVRQLGKDLGLPEHFTSRHPFPGPGLAIRIICAAKPTIQADYAEKSSLLDLIVNYSRSLSTEDPRLQTIHAGLAAVELEQLEKASQAFSCAAMILPISSVGVQGDVSSYKHAVALSSDQAPCWSSIMHLAKVITQFCLSVNRVVYVFGSKLTQNVIDITPTYLTEDVLNTARELDYEANSVLKVNGCTSKISQMPIVLLPLHFDRDTNECLPSCHRSAVIRAFMTDNYMAGLPACPGSDIPEKVIFEMAERMRGVCGISRIMYDCTGKPPAVTEWE